jgi:predicted enzyme related to lactoylglutathione lyase
MAVEQVAVVSVPVSDPERAKAFYVDKLGFEVRNDIQAPEMRWIEVAPRGDNTTLTLVTWFDSMPAGSLRGLVLRSKDIESDFRQLSEKGVEFVGPPQTQPWGTDAVFRDPDGNQLVLQQAA